MKIYIAAVMVFIVFQNFAHAKEEFEYYSPPRFIESDENVSVYDKRMTISLEEEKIFVGDMSSVAHNCSDNEWLCLSIPSDFDFAFKKSWSIPPGEWKKNDVSYSYHGEKKIDLLGVKKSGMLICAESKQHNVLDVTANTCFIFSKIDGILMIVVYDENFEGPFKNIYIARKKRGIFASP